MHDSKEMLKIVIMIAESYPTFYNKKEKDTLESTVKVYQSLLSDIDPKILQTAVLEWICKNKFPPTIADIREMCNNVKQKKHIDVNESWTELRKNIQKYGIYNAEEGIKELSEITRKCVDVFGYRQLCTCENLNVMFSQYQKTFKIYEKRARENELTPMFLQRRIQLIRENISGNKNKVQIV